MSCCIYSDGDAPLVECSRQEAGLPLSSRTTPISDGPPKLFVGGAILLLFGIVLLSISSGHQVSGAYWSARSYEHYCDNNWLQVEFVSHLNHNPTSRNVATFSLVETGETLFKFTSSDPASDKFTLAGLNSSRPSVLPALRSVRFDESEGTFSGECFKPLESSCGLSGSIKSTNGLSFETTMSGPKPVTISLRNLYSDWSFEKLSQVILYFKNQSTGGLEDLEPVLTTSVAMPHRCDRQKICISRAVTSDVLGLEIIVPTGWLLQKFSEYALWCSFPRMYYGV